MACVLSPLSYGLTGLEPYLSEKTLTFHYEKHHRGYVTNLNTLIKDTPLDNLSLESIIQETAGKPEFVPQFNNAAQVWNHDFFWKSMGPKGGGEPKGLIAERINQTFGSHSTFCDAFQKMGMSQFGSGWVWLVKNSKDDLSLMKTGNADLPLIHGLTPLVTCDVWEHAYYLDYQNRRVDYIKTFLENLINWNFGEENLKAL